MIEAALTTERITLEDGRSAIPYEWRGETVLVTDNALNALTIYELMTREDAGEQNAVSIISLIFADPDDAFCACDFNPIEFGKLVSSALWDVFGIDNEGGRTEEPLWDPVEDAALVRVSLRAAYGIDWDVARLAMSWTEFATLVSALPIETPLGAAIYYRDKRNRPKPTKNNREMVEEFDRRHKLLALKNDHRGSHDDADQSNAAMNDAALAINAIARRE